jgi:hypothetical protein
MLETDWLKAKQIWLGMGPDRNLRALQRWIEVNHNQRMPLELLQAEISSRNFLFDALEHDKKIARRVDAMTVDSLSQQMAQARLQSFADMTRRFKDFGDIVDRAMASVIKRAEFGKVSIADARHLMETYLKVLEYQENYQIPMLPDMSDDPGASLPRDPAALAGALLAVNRIKDMDLDEIRDAQG